MAKSDLLRGARMTLQHECRFLSVCGRRIIHFDNINLVVATSAGEQLAVFAPRNPGYTPWKSLEPRHELASRQVTQMHLWGLLAGDGEVSAGWVEGKTVRNGPSFKRFKLNPRSSLIQVDGSPMVGHRDGAAIGTEAQAASADSVRSRHEFLLPGQVPNVKTSWLIFDCEHFVVLTKPQNPKGPALARQKSNFRVVAHAANADISILIAAGIAFDFMSKGDSGGTRRERVPGLLRTHVGQSHAGNRLVAQRQVWPHARGLGENFEAVETAA